MRLMLIFVQTAVLAQQFVLLMHQRQNKEIIYSKQLRNPYPDQVRVSFFLFHTKKKQTSCAEEVMTQLAGYDQ